MGEEAEGLHPKHSVSSCPCPKLHTILDQAPIGKDIEIFFNDHWVLEVGVIPKEIHQPAEVLGTAHCLHLS